MKTNKIFRVVEPGFRLYFIVLVIYVAAAAFINKYLGIAGAVLAVGMYILFQVTSAKRQRAILKQMESITYDVDSATKSSMLYFPMPIVIIRVDNGDIVWSNDKFVKLCGQKDYLFEMKIDKAVPEFKTRWLLEGKSECPELAVMEGRKYRVFGNIVRYDNAGYRRAPIATTYWVDVTEYEDTKNEFKETRPVVSIIALDNYEDLVKNLTPSASSALLAELDHKISEWISFTNGIICKYDRDRYMIIFEEKFMAELNEKKFDVLDSVRKVVNPAGVAATLSIGFGRDGHDFGENYQFASMGLEMALSRGGDQAVIKNRFNFEFYGGKSKEMEKRTKVKSRVVASALGELIAGSSQVFVFGHKMADMDSVGSAAGVICIARKKGKRAYIVIDEENNASHELIKRLKEAEEYRDVFINEQDAIIMTDNKSLVVVVDTNRPDQVEAPSLLTTGNQIAVIDHHRRAAEYISDVTLNFHEPYASSAAELVSELLQYLAEQSDILRVEAEALLAGLMLDTKNFTMRTGSRTFEAAAFLRRVGADTSEVKKLLQNDFASTVQRYEIISAAQVFKNNIAIAAVDRQVDRIIAAQAADELLTISGIDTSFVMFRTIDGIFISARSIGDINVQIIMEKMGGGGNKATAAAQVHDKQCDEVRQILMHTIEEYLAE